MPVEGVDTFSCLCVPDLECAISGAADDDVVSHLRWPYAARVAHQRAQTLKRPQTKKILDECFLGRADPSFQTCCCCCVCCGSLQIVFTERPDIQNTPIHLHYRCRLVIDSHSYRNRSDQLNLQLYAVSFAPERNYSTFNGTHSGTGRVAHAVQEVGGELPWLVPSEWQRSAPWRCTTCDLTLTTADKSGEFRSEASGVWEEDEAAARRPALSCDKGNHFINRGPMWHDRTINLAAMFYYPTPLFTAVKRIIVQLEEHLTQLFSLIH